MSGDMFMFMFMVWQINDAYSWTTRTLGFDDERCED